MKCKKLERLVHALIAQSHGKVIAQQCRQQASLKVQVSLSDPSLLQRLISLSARTCVWVQDEINVVQM